MNETPLYHLSQFEANDLPDWMNSYNTDMQKIETGLVENNYNNEITAKDVTKLKTTVNDSHEKDITALKINVENTAADVKLLQAGQKDHLAKIVANTENIRKNTDNINNLINVITLKGANVTSNMFGPVLKEGNSGTEKNGVHPSTIITRSGNVVSVRIVLLTAVKDANFNPSSRVMLTLPEVFGTAEKQTLNLVSWDYDDDVDENGIAVKPLIVVEGNTLSLLKPSSGETKIITLGGTLHIYGTYITA